VLDAMVVWLMAAMRHSLNINVYPLAREENHHVRIDT
jgi:hypothetical protein